MTITASLAIHRHGSSDRNSSIWRKRPRADPDHSGEPAGGGKPLRPQRVSNRAVASVQSGIGSAGAGGDAAAFCGEYREPRQWKTPSKPRCWFKSRIAGEKQGGVIISFEGAFHGRTLGALAVTHRKKARLGFPTFDWPQASFPTEDPNSPAATQRREERSLRQVWDFLQGRVTAGARRLRRTWGGLTPSWPRRETRAAFVAAQRERIGNEALKRAWRVAAVLIEPVQGEGGVRMASARFFRRLRLLTLVYDVPLIFDEVQTGFGATGRLWGRTSISTSRPRPSIVTWAKKAQNGVLFISEAIWRSSSRKRRSSIRPGKAIRWGCFG